MLITSYDSFTEIWPKLEEGFQELNFMMYSSRNPRKSRICYFPAIFTTYIFTHIKF